MNNIREICGDQLALAAENGGFIVHPYRSAAMGSWSRNWAQFHTILRGEDMSWRQKGDDVNARMRTLEHFHCPTAFNLQRSEMAELDGHQGWK